MFQNLPRILEGCTLASGDLIKDLLIRYIEHLKQMLKIDMKHKFTAKIPFYEVMRRLR